MSAATITESSSSTLKDQQPTVVETLEEMTDNTLTRELSKKEKQRQKKEQKEKEKKEKEERERERKEKEKREKERKEREKKEKKEKEKKDKKNTNDQDELISSPITVVNASETKEDDGPALPPIPVDSSELVQTPVTSLSDSITHSRSPTTVETPLELQGQEPPVTNDSTPAQSRELSNHEEPLAVNTNLPTGPHSLEGEITDATQTSINDPSDPSSPNKTASPDAKKNWANAIGSVRGFLVRTSNTVVEKISQKLEELDDHLMEQYSDDELYEIEHQERLTQDGPVGEGSQNARLLEQQQREELLGTPDGPPPVPPKDQKYGQIQQETSSTQSVMAENLNALAERGQKLEQLNDKLENMSNSSSEFARIAKELADREANKKWYQIW